MKCQALICTNCQKDFNYPNNEYNRRTRKGITQFFCSLSCSASYRNTHRSPELQEKMRIANIGNKHGRGNKRGKFTYYLNKSRNRKSRKVYEETNLDEEYLQSIWTGKCAYTNVPIVLYQPSKNSLYNASLDRIDSSKGYIKGNVQWVCLGINYAKNGFSDQEMKEFIDHIQISRMLSSD